jgi:TolA-binding protein
LILETRTDDKLGAIEVYESVIEKYPGTDYAEAASRAIDRLTGSDASSP